MKTAQDIINICIRFDLQRPAWVVAAISNAGTMTTETGVPHNLRPRYVCGTLTQAREALENFIDGVQIGNLDAQDYAVFHFCENWQDKKPRLLRTFQDRSHDKIGTLSGSLINSLQSDWM